MIILRDIAFLWAVCHALIIAACLFESRFSYRKTTALLLVALTPVVLVNIGLYLLIGPEQMARILLLTASLPCMLVFFCLSRQRNGRLFFTYFLSSTAVFSCILVTSMIDYYLVGNRNIFFFVSQIILYPAAEVILWKYVRKFYRDLLRTVQNGWGLFAGVSVLFFALMIMMGAWPTGFYHNPGQALHLLLMIVLMAMVYLTIFQVLYFQQKVFYTMEEDHMSAMRAQLLHNELETERQFVFNAKRYRHDLHHHGKVVYEYLQQNDVEAAKSYLQIYRDQLEDAALENYCAHPTANALLRITARQCKAKNISFTAEGDVPENLPLSDPEIGIVLGNLLENACEAAEKTKNGFVSIRAEERGNVLYVELRNSVDGRVKFDGDMPRSTKQTGGIGIQSVNAALERYDGMLSFRQEGKTFLTRLILPL